MAANTSAYALLVYYIVTLFPHLYAAYLLNSVGATLDSSNPYSTDALSLIKKKTPAKIFAKYERARAAHKNGMENMALFFGAVTLGNVARLEVGTLNGVAWVYVGTRILYTAAYIGISSASLSRMRSLVWATGVGMCMYLIVKSGARLGDI